LKKKKEVLINSLEEAAPSSQMEFRLSQGCLEGAGSSHKVYSSKKGGSGKTYRLVPEQKKVGFVIEAMGDDPYEGGLIGQGEGEGGRTQQSVFRGEHQGLPFDPKEAFSR